MSKRQKLSKEQKRLVKEIMEQNNPQRKVDEFFQKALKEKESSTKT